VGNFITGEQSFEFSVSYLNSGTSHFADTDGKIYEKSSNSNQVRESVLARALYRLRPRLQVGIEIPYLINSLTTVKELETTRQVGDVEVESSYEVYRNDESLVFSNIFHYYKQVFPLTDPIYNSQKKLFTDAMGEGLFISKIGASLFNAFYPFDYSFTVEFQEGFNRNFNEYKINPGLRSLFSGNLGVDLSQFQQGLRFQSSVTFFNNEGSQVSISSRDSKYKSYFWQLRSEFSYLFSKKEVSVFYVDQSFLAKALRTDLAKIIGLKFSFFI
jgi:hypothetical protein